MMMYMSMTIDADASFASNGFCDAPMKELSFQEVARHNTASDCWVVLKGVVYDLTAFAKEHPGGSELVTDLAGTDGTVDFLDAHQESIIQATLPAHEYTRAIKGNLDPSTVPAQPLAGEEIPTAPAPEGAITKLSQVLLGVLSGVAKSVLARTAAAMLTRSSLLLICFLVVHLAGNLTAFMGARQFNAYADAMALNPVCTIASLAGCLD